MVGNVVEAINAKGGSTLYEYDNSENLEKISTPLGITNEFTYDFRNNVLTAKDGKGNIVEIKDSNDIVIQKAVYDFNNKPLEITDALGNTVKATYDGLGNQLTYTTARGNQYNYDYDRNGRVVKVTDPLEGVAESVFDARGNQTGLKDQNNNQTEYSYDLLNRFVSETTADGFSDAYAYDNLGALTSYINKRGQKITYTYDADGRRTSRVTPEGTTTYTYDNNNNVLTVTDTNGTISRTYDSLNRVTSYTNTDGQTISYEYDNNGNLTKLTYPDGKTVRYTYNANNQMSTVTDWNNRVTTYAYDNNGRLISEIRPNGTIQTYTYNNAGQLVSTTDKKADGSVINKYDYEYDADGNIVTEDSINEPNYNNITIPSSEMNYGSANRLVDFNGTAISYDNDGNMLNTPLGDKWGALTYNSQNMLTDVVTSDGAIEYEYDAENYRTLKTEYNKTTSYVVNPNAELSQVLMSTTDGETTYYIYGLGLIAQETQNSYDTYHYDYRGSATAITDSNGNVTDRIYYDAYGKIITRTGTSEIPFLYVGKYGVEIDDCGLYYMRARYYNLAIQRFVNVDPIRDGLNWYGYVGGNPAKNIDFNGLITFAISSSFISQFGVNIGKDSTFVFDMKGNFAFINSDIYDFGSPSASVSQGITVTNANTIYDYMNVSFAIGGSVTPEILAGVSVGADYVFGEDNDKNAITGGSLSLGVGIGPEETHIKYSETTFVYDRNDFFIDLKNYIIDFFYTTSGEYVGNIIKLVLN